MTSFALWQSPPPATPHAALVRGHVAKAAPAVATTTKPRFRGAVAVLAVWALGLVWAVGATAMAVLTGT